MMQGNSNIVCSYYREKACVLYRQTLEKLDWHDRRSVVVPLEFPSFRDAVRSSAFIERKRVWTMFYQELLEDVECCGVVASSLMEKFPLDFCGTAVLRLSFLHKCDEEVTLAFLENVNTIFSTRTLAMRWLRQPFAVVAGTAVTGREECSNLFTSTQQQLQKLERMDQAFRSLGFIDM